MAAFVTNAAVIAASALLGAGAALALTLTMEQQRAAEPSVQFPVSVNGVMPETAELSADDEQREYLETRRWRDEHAAKLAIEARDPDWAAATEATLRTELQDFEELYRRRSASGFTLANVECRSSLCRVRLLWPDQAHAASASAPLAQHNYRLYCAVSSLVHDGPELFTEQGYLHELFFRCRPRGKTAEHAPSRGT